MITAAIVEDQEAFTERLDTFLKQYEAESGVTFSARFFADCASFLKHCCHAYDIVFIDSHMINGGGTDFLGRIQTRIPSAAVVLLEVPALPAAADCCFDEEYTVLMSDAYPVFSVKLTRLLKNLIPGEDRFLRIATRHHTYRIQKNDIRYIETDGHHLVYHTTEGDITQYSSMKAVEKLLDPRLFVRCNACYLINLIHVTELEESEVRVGRETLRISKGKKKAFHSAFCTYLEKYGHKAPDTA
ncbi:MAG: response regulator transcription factor [Lachnospiraceae bacterium]|nr:response regulator transcription factor [Lachnospiraceae bacterium]